MWPCPLTGPQSSAKEDACGECGGEPDVMKQPCFVIEAEQEGADLVRPREGGFGAAWPRQDSEPSSACGVVLRIVTGEKS